MSRQSFWDAPVAFMLADARQVARVDETLPLVAAAT